MEQVTDKKAYDQNFMDNAIRKLAWKRLQKNTVVNSDILIYKRTSDILDLEHEVGYACKV